jgi:hypothetical protein
MWKEHGSTSHFSVARTVGTWKASERPLGSGGHGAQVVTEYDYPEQYDDVAFGRLPSMNYPSYLDTVSAFSGLTPSELLASPSELLASPSESS